MSEYPVRPEMRVVCKVKVSDFSLALLEQPDLLVDEPYLILMKSNLPALGRGEVSLSFATKVEALYCFAGHMTSWLGTLESPERISVENMVKQNSFLQAVFKLAAKGRMA